MASAKKQPVKRTKAHSPGKARAKAVAGSLVLVALERLREQEVRDRLAEQARVAAERTKIWLAESKRDRSGDPNSDAPAKARPLSDRLRQRKLERRVKRLSASVTDLSRARPELSELLAVPTATLKEIGSALNVAGGLPQPTRAHAQLQIERQLDELEAMVFDVAMPKDA